MLDERRIRTYEASHSWIDFTANLKEAPTTLWMLFGEARSKCHHIAGVPLEPAAASKLYRIYLSKGVHATTSIEGNSLSEEQVQQRIEKKLKLPVSQEYLGREVDNVVDACNQIARTLSKDPNLKLTPELICEFNGLILGGLDVEDHVRPGAYRTESVGVAGYRGAPWEDCPYLMERLCEWLNTSFEPMDEDWKFAYALIKSIFAHLYIAWIHPFGDGNGRTARLIEFLLLVQSGVPWPAAHLLSNHYNKTRERYYAGLDKSSKAKDGVIEFLTYAIRGFVDGLTEQLEYIRGQQWRVTWENYVHEFFRDKDTPAHKRRKHLVLDLPAEVTPRKRLARISPRVAAEYARKGEKTLTRDINELVSANLLARAEGGFKPNRDLILAFLPPRCEDISQGAKSARPE
jgi:Fic family protein